MTAYERYLAEVNKRRLRLAALRGKGWTLRAIAKQEGISPARVLQLVRKAKPA